MFAMSNMRNYTTKTENEKKHQFVGFFMVAGEFVCFQSVKLSKALGLCEPVV